MGIKQKSSELLLDYNIGPLIPTTEQTYLKPKILIENKKKLENKKNSNTVIKNSVFSENTKENYNKNQKLFQLNEQNIKKIYGEKYKELSEEDKIHLFDRKINNSEIKEKINLNITMKNPNKDYKYETEIYDDDNKLITKTEQQQSDKNENILIDTEMLYKFAKSQSITIVINKHINLNETIRTKMTIPLQKIISKNNNENYEEKIEDFQDNEIINIDYDSPKENKDENLKN